MSSQAGSGSGVGRSRDWQPLKCRQGTGTTHTGNAHLSALPPPPFTVGQHGTVEECLILYTDHSDSSRLADEVGELAGKRLRSDTPDGMPCTVDVLIVMGYYAWMEGAFKMQQGDAKTKRWARLFPNRWAKRALGLMAAMTDDAWWATCSKEGSMARQPPLSLKRTHH